MLAPQSSSYSSSSSIGQSVFKAPCDFSTVRDRAAPRPKHPENNFEDEDDDEYEDNRRPILALRGWAQKGVLGPLLLFRSQALTQFGLDLLYRVRRSMNMMFAVVFGQQALVGVT